MNQSISTRNRLNSSYFEVNVEVPTKHVFPEPTKTRVGQRLEAIERDRLRMKFGPARHQTESSIAFGSRIPIVYASQFKRSDDAQRRVGFSLVQKPLLNITTILT